MLQNIEVLITQTNNYLLIHKNGCSQVRKHLYENFPQVEFKEYFPSNNKLNWTVVRDPYNRFISGLTYDLLRQFKTLDNLYKIIKNTNFSTFFYEKINLRSRPKGNVNHTALQWTYLFFQPIDFLVNIKDLDNFLDIHFQKRFNYTETNTLSEYKDIVLNYIEKDKHLKDLILAYLAPDYYYMQQAQFQGLFWSWQQGKMF